jgi:hypothetical protein
MNSHGIFWLLVIAIAASAFCFCAYTVNKVPNKDVEMARAGYIEKVVVIGDPNNQYTRQIIKVWVKSDGTPIVEQK